MQASPTTVTHAANGTGNPVQTLSYLDLQVQRHHRMREPHSCNSRNDWLYSSNTNLNTFNGTKDHNTVDNHKPNTEPPAQFPRAEQFDGMTTLYLAAQAMGDFDSYADCSESRNWCGDSASGASSGGFSSGFSAASRRYSVSSDSNSGAGSRSESPMSDAGVGSWCSSDSDTIVVDVDVNVVDDCNSLSSCSQTQTRVSTSSGIGSVSPSPRRLPGTKTEGTRGGRSSLTPIQSNSSSSGSTSSDDTSMERDGSSFELGSDGDQNEDQTPDGSTQPAQISDDSDELPLPLPVPPGRRMTTRSLTKHQNRSGNRKRSRGSADIQSDESHSAESGLEDDTGSEMSSETSGRNKLRCSTSNRNTTAAIGSIIAPAYRILHSSAAPAAAPGDSGSGIRRRAVGTRRESKGP
ncbi:hypothetical protein D9619_009182 [Psilocybe cf. subviscida]|uniref:Uncharacterized protein n=1 Tax=Psilocybe cf. subviscida TaxID=2480587 RepID=A0A8H5BTM5_9AGAR|nr:hypothetical protein D9619_009182 [Psilocybe cf. subviscida]